MTASVTDRTLTLAGDRDGTTPTALEPLALMARLAASISARLPR